MSCSKVSNPNRNASLSYQILGGFSDWVRNLPSGILHHRAIRHRGDTEVSVFTMLGRLLRPLALNYLATIYYCTVKCIQV